MIQGLQISSWHAEARKRIIVALDMDDADRAYAVAGELRDSVGAVKIGLQLFTAAGPSVVRRFVDAGFKVFLDLKFHDIPNTAAMASVEAAKMGVWMLNLHASGGKSMMTAAREAVDEWSGRANKTSPIMIGVTVLTSADAGLLSEVGSNETVSERVGHLARLAYDSGLDGVVASAHEINAIKAAVDNGEFLTVTPGIRSVTATVDDQKRVTTLRGALTAGANYVVIGRPITGEADPAAAVERMLDEK